MKSNESTTDFCIRLLKIANFPLIVLIAPFFLLIISVILLITSVKFIQSDSEISEKLIKYSLKSISISRIINLGNPVYNNYSNIVYKSAKVMEEVFETARVTNEFASKILGDQQYDLPKYTNTISGSLDRIHTDFGFLQSDINELNDIGGKKLKKYLGTYKIDINEYKSRLVLLKNFTSRLSILLGMDKPMKYLILFQNNMELRPTGGFIGSFAIISLDKGKLTEIVVNDVYSADGQLKGHVDPPEPIRVHLGEGGWFLRDANWDPSFPDSALKIEWFLDKEIGTKVDGVIAIDLEFIQKVLQVIGPINLVDFDKTITADNLYVSTQDEVESDFFPGSIKKASFVTGLLNQLMIELESIKSDKYRLLLNAIYTSLEERHIQLFLHDLNAQESVNSLGYSGSIEMNTDCGMRCYVDTYSVIDANLGVNKANLFIKREQELNLTISKRTIGHDLLVTYQNVSSQAFGNSVVYKSYTRLVLPKNAKLISLKSYDLDGKGEDLSFESIDINDRKEIGFLINVIPNSSKKIKAAWDIETDNLENGGEVRLLVRKQAGTVNDNFKAIIYERDISLTGRVPTVYTTNLRKDFSLKLFFQP